MSDIHPSTRHPSTNKWHPSTDLPQTFLSGNRVQQAIPTTFLIHTLFYETPMWWATSIKQQMTPIHKRVTSVHRPTSDISFRKSSAASNTNHHLTSNTSLWEFYMVSDIHPATSDTHPETSDTHLQMSDISKNDLVHFLQEIQCSNWCQQPPYFIHFFMRILCGEQHPSSNKWHPSTNMWHPSTKWPHSFPSGNPMQQLMPTTNLIHTLLYENPTWRPTSIQQQVISIHKWVTSVHQMTSFISFRKSNATIDANNHLTWYTSLGESYVVSDIHPPTSDTHRPTYLIHFLQEIQRSKWCLAWHSHRQSSPADRGHQRGAVGARRLTQHCLQLVRWGDRTTKQELAHARTKRTQRAEGDEQLKDLRHREDNLMKKENQGKINMFAHQMDPCEVYYLLLWISQWVNGYWFVRSTTNSHFHRACSHWERNKQTNSQYLETKSTHMV